MNDLLFDNWFFALPMFHSYWFWGMVLVFLFTEVGLLGGIFIATVLWGFGYIAPSLWYGTFSVLDSGISVFSTTLGGVHLMEIAAFFTGLFAGLWAWPILTLMVLLCVFAVGLAYEREGWVTSGVLLILGGTLFAYWKDLSWVMISAYVIGYVVIGVFATYPLYISYSRRKARQWKEHLGAYLRVKGWYVNSSRDTFFNDWYYANVNREYWRQGEVPSNITDRVAYYEKNAPEGFKEKADKAWDDACLTAMLKSWNSKHTILRVDGQTNFDGGWSVTPIKPMLVGQMILWWAYWPAYSVAMILRDVVRNFWEWVIENIGGHFSKISTGHFNSA